MSAAKAVVAAVSSGVAGLAGSLITAATDGHITAVEVVVAVCAGAIAATGGGVVTYATANKPNRPV